MRRTNLVLDAEALEEATRILGLKTYSATVNEALKEVIRREGLRRLAGTFGRVRWRGSLAEMREDHPRRACKRKPAR
jgi:Arc/MetJ family transcription regulator